MYDLIIKDGTLIDGTGAAARRGDVGIRHGRIAALGDLAGAVAGATIDATGKLVTPGFVEVHSHYDGQFLWDDKLDPSFSNGVTTVIAGNCGVGFAPVRPQHRQQLVELMEGVEDIPEIVLNIGLVWDWETFPEYLDRLDQRRYSMDIAVQIPHAPVRVFVMGERALNHEAATAADIAAMETIIEEGMRAGAIGVSGSRILEHRSSRGTHVPGTFAEEGELLALARAMGRTGKGTMQMVTLGTVGAALGPQAGRAARLDEHRRMENLARVSGRPVTYILQQFDSDPEDWRMMLDEVDKSAQAGYQVIPTVAARAFGVLSCLDGFHPFQMRPSYIGIAQLPLSERVLAMRLPGVRSAILNEADVSVAHAPSARVAAMIARFGETLGKFYPMHLPLDYEPQAQARLDALSSSTGRSMEELLYDHFCAGDGANVAVDFALNYAHGNLDAVRAMLDHPCTATGLGDGGAHMRIICDASMPTFHLTFWARDRTRGPKLALETLVKKHTHDNARLYGLDDRGTLEVGQRADINVIDFEQLALEMPRMAFDLPGGGGRLLQSARGYVATIVNGVVTRRADQDTGHRPGRLVRGAQL